ncbi:solute carrier family 35 member C2-like isoform X2 [Lineus longissimus]|uniref:solute carrier family 35 member C2-like isoform X2 n=1 Tax=Lineus longissimus TaxID=88925 RepID=UPI00315CBA83
MPVKSRCSWASVCFGVQTVSLVLFFYTFSITLTFYNKKFITMFRFPLSITIFHLFIKFLLALLCRTIWELKTGKERILLSWDLYVRKVAPTGISSSLDIGLSNWSFEYITVSLYTMTKSTSIVFILGFSLLFGLEKKMWSLIFVVMFIAAGLFMFTYQSTQFNLEGFLLVLTASLLSGIRWTLAQMLTQKKEIGLSNPLDMIYHVQPWMILALLPLSVYFEGMFVATTQTLFGAEDLHVVLKNFGLLLIGALLAFMLEISEYLLVSFTSGLTLCIAGIFKEICTLALAAEINGDRMTLLNFLGLVVCLAGIALHVVLKAHSTKAAEKKKEIDELIELEKLSED